MSGRLSVSLCTVGTRSISMPCKGFLYPGALTVSPTVFQHLVHCRAYNWPTRNYVLSDKCHSRKMSASRVVERLIFSFRHIQVTKSIVTLLSLRYDSKAPLESVCHRCCPVCCLSVSLVEPCLHSKYLVPYRGRFRSGSQPSQCHIQRQGQRESVSKYYGQLPSLSKR
jgi:hypothetical protein